MTAETDFFNSGFQDCGKSRFLYIRTQRCGRMEPVAVRGGTPLANGQIDATGKDDARSGEREKSLNFKVRPEFWKDFKGFAVAQGISMTDLLKEGFELSKKRRQK